jgi:hypothetical protein
MPNPFTKGVVVVYHAQKVSTHPAPHAVDVEPSSNGDDYSYAVDKFWRVDEVLPDGQIVVRTRRGKRRTISASDPALRPVSWWEWFFCWHRFPPVEAPAEGEAVIQQKRR